MDAHRSVRSTTRFQGSALLCNAACAITMGQEVRVVEINQYGCINHAFLGTMGPAKKFPHLGEININSIVQHTKLITIQCTDLV